MFRATHPLFRQQKHTTLFGNGIVGVKLHQFVEGTELLVPEIILPTPASHHFKVLNVIFMSDSNKHTA